MKQKIGFMGLGIMGNAMAANLLKAGYPVTVYNRSPEKAEPLVRQGAGRADNPQALATASDVVIVMVTGPEALEELLFGPGGAAGALECRQIFCQHEFRGAELHPGAGGPAQTHRAWLIDAPVSGTKKPAEEGTLLVLAGGPRDKVQAVEPVLLAMGKKVIYCGEAGQGSMMKMFINLLLGLMMEAFAEVLNFSRLGGLTEEAMLDTIFSGPLNCGMFQVKAPNLQNHTYPTAFPLKHMTKDIKFIVDTA